MTTPPAPPTVDPDAGEAGTLVVEGPRFAIVPEWMIDSPIPDAGFRLYSLLLRYGNSSGTRMPSRATLAHRLRRSVDAVDRALRQLVEADVVRVEHRRCDGVFLANRYHVRTTGPSGGGGRTSAATAASLTEGGRNIAATGGRRTAAGVAADLRPNPEDSTQSTPPPPGSNRPGSAASTASEPNPVEMADLQLLKACGIADVDQLSAACVAARHAVGRPATRWSARCLMVVIRLTVNGKGWPAEGVAAALLEVAKDPATRSPARVAEAGPWWDAAILETDLRVDARELAELEWRLAESGGRRPAIQAQARRELAAERLPVTRAGVARRGCQILDRTPTTSDSAAGHTTSETGSLPSTREEATP